MDRLKALEAFEKKQLVARFRPGYPHQPYIGLLVSRLESDMYWFEGVSETEVIQCRVGLHEIFPAERR